MAISITLSLLKQKVGSLDSLIGIQIHEDNKFVEFDSDVNIYRLIILETIDKFEIDNQPNENVFNIFKYFNLNIYTKSKAKKIKIIIKV